MKQITKIAILLSIIPLVSGIEMAEALSISGKVLSGGSGLVDAKVTAEKVGEYQWARTTSGGNYVVTVNTSNQYTVDSMKTAYTRDTDPVNGGNSAPDQTISTRTQTDIKYKVAFDTSSSITLSSAKAALLLGEPWFTEEHSIDFIETTSSYSWTSAGTTATCGNLLDDLVTDANWPTTTSGADMLFGYSAVNVGTGTKACMLGTGVYDSKPAILVMSSSPDIARSVMHELSHAYDMTHTGVACNTQIPNIMATNTSDQACTAEYIKNWNPTQDATMESSRSRW